MRNKLNSINLNGATRINTLLMNDTALSNAFRGAFSRAAIRNDVINFIIRSFILSSLLYVGRVINKRYIVFYAHIIAKSFSMQIVRCMIYAECMCEIQN